MRRARCTCRALASASAHQHRAQAAHRRHSAACIVTLQGQSRTAHAVAGLASSGPARNAARQLSGLCCSRANATRAAVSRATATGKLTLRNSMQLTAQGRTASRLSCAGPAAYDGSVSPERQRRPHTARKHKRATLLRHLPSQPRACRAREGASGPWHTARESSLREGCQPTPARTRQRVVATASLPRKRSCDRPSQPAHASGLLEVCFDRIERVCAQERPQRLCTAPESLAQA